MPKIQTINIFLEHIANSGWRKSMTPLICKMAGKIQNDKNNTKKNRKECDFSFNFSLIFRKFIFYSYIFHYLNPQKKAT
ncbi:MAG: hypothetical protein IKG79_01110 [Neisseriaceae bacterium]|nr:hypothetical protein [Neisseriaceae bacterium]